MTLSKSMTNEANPMQKDMSATTGAHVAKTVARYLVMAAIVGLMVLPFLWMLSTSLKEQQYILQMPPQLIPNPVTLSSYTQLAERINLGRTFLNSVMVALVGTVGQIVIAAMCAYSFER